jgi:hypothetical protein
MLLFALNTIPRSEGQHVQGAVVYLSYVYSVTVSGTSHATTATMGAQAAPEFWSASQPHQPGLGGRAREGDSFLVAWVAKGVQWTAGPAVQQATPGSSPLQCAPMSCCPRCICTEVFKGYPRLPNRMH